MPKGVRIECQGSLNCSWDGSEPRCGLQELNSVGTVGAQTTDSAASLQYFQRRGRKAVGMSQVFVPNTS